MPKQLEWVENERGFVAQSIVAPELEYQLLSDGDEWHLSAIVKKDGLKTVTPLHGPDTLEGCKQFCRG